MTKFDSVKAGDVLYDVRRVPMGNTTMRRTSCWAVVVESIDYEKRTAMCCWNGNRAKRYFAGDIERLRRTPPKEKT